MYIKCSGHFSPSPPTSSLTYSAPSLLCPGCGLSRTRRCCEEEEFNLLSQERGVPCQWKEKKKAIVYFRSFLCHTLNLESLPDFFDL
jgi:hypothetical protein